MWPSVGAPMFFQLKAKVIRSPWTRTTPVALPSGSPTAGFPATGTSLRPDSRAAKNTGFWRARAIAAFRSGWESGALLAAVLGMFMPGIPGMDGPGVWADGEPYAAG